MNQNLVNFTESVITSDHWFSEIEEVLIQTQLWQESNGKGERKKVYLAGLSRAIWWEDEKFGLMVARWLQPNFKIVCFWPFGLEGLWLHPLPLPISTQAQSKDRKGSNFAIWQPWVWTDLLRDRQRWMLIRRRQSRRRPWRSRRGPSLRRQRPSWTWGCWRRSGCSVGSCSARRQRLDAGTCEREKSPVAQS